MAADEPFDIEIGAAARARRVRFKHVPETDVRFALGPEDVAESQTERENLPERVEPGVEYRDVRVAWRAGVEIEGRTRKES
jgi:hypothetical protein